MSKIVDNLIVGAGVAGLACAYELLKDNQPVYMVDAQTETEQGGLAKDAFGGMALVGTPLQKHQGIDDNPELAWRDWCSFAQFQDTDIWPKRWAKYYVEHSYDKIYTWLTELGIRFLPLVNWVERGDKVKGNSVPRYHVIWGTGRYLVNQLISAISSFNKQLTCQWQTKVTDIQKLPKTGYSVQLSNGQTIECKNLILACGGINGNLDKVRENWDTSFSPAPKPLLNGSHPSADGSLHERVNQLGGRVTHLEWMWNYAAGIEHPNAKFKHHGLSLIPPKTALWVDAFGNRIGPEPMVTAFDTHDLCHRIANLPHQYSWQILNRKIALKEIAVSGSDMNPSIRDRSIFGLARDVLFGNKWLVDYLTTQCPDVITASSLPELVEKMNDHSPQANINELTLRSSLEPFDRQLKQGVKFHNDAQLRRISQLRNWKGDRVRTYKSQPILDEKAGPLIAIKETIISRKSMGGMQTNLNSQVLDNNGDSLPGLYAIGEAAGFGGGGISGNRSLEGTFLSSCILTARQAASAITVA